MGVGPAPHYRDRSTELYPSPNKSMQGASQPDRGGVPAPLGMVIGAGAVHAHQRVMQGWARDWFDASDGPH